MIKVVKRFRYNQNFVTEGYLPLPLDYIHVQNREIFKKSSSLKPPDFTWGLQSKEC